MKTAIGVIARAAATACFMACVGFASAAAKPTAANLLDMNKLDNMQPNGEYAVYVWKGGTWKNAGSIHCDRFLRKQTLNLSEFVAAGLPARVRIAERGGGAAHIDAVSLGGLAPENIKGSDEILALRKIAERDCDVIDAFGRVIELEFPAAAEDKNLAITARIEGNEISSIPFQFPLENLFRSMDERASFYAYRLDTGSSEKPFFMEFSPTGSGHPAGYTYGWVTNDENNLYVKIDFTPDNTVDGNKDYAKVYIMTPDGLRMFMISSSETRWGRVNFTYTDIVPYQHKVYDFAIPFGELGIRDAGGIRELQIAFAAYGTASPGLYAPELAYNPSDNTYLVAFLNVADSTGENYICGVFADGYGEAVDGSFVIMGPIDQYKSQLFSSVSFDGENDRFLVLAEDHVSPGSGYVHIRGQIVSEDGSLFGSSIDLTDTDTYQYNPSSAFDPYYERYLVVWQDSRNSATSGVDIYGALVDKDGNVMTVGYAANFSISTASFTQSNPAVAYDSDNRRFLVVWQDSRNGDSDIYGQLVNADGSKRGSNFVISNQNDEQATPAVVYDKKNNRYLVVWDDDRNGNSDIYGQLVNEYGSLYGTSSNANFIVSANTSLEYDPCVIFDHAQECFLVVWTDYLSGSRTKTDIYGVYVNPTGSLAAPAFAVWESTDYEVTPSAAYNSICGSSMVAFGMYGGSEYYVGLVPVGEPCSGIYGYGYLGECLVENVFGAESVEDVQLLRDFRDRHLSTNIFGRAVVREYRRYSPPLSRYLADHERLRAAVRMGLAAIVILIRNPATVLIGLTVIALIAIYRLRARRRRV